MLTSVCSPFSLPPSLYRLAVLHHTPLPSPDLLQLLHLMVGLLGLVPPTDASSHSMTGLMGMSCLLHPPHGGAPVISCRYWI